MSLEQVLLDPKNPQVLRRLMQLLREIKCPPVIVLAAVLLWGQFHILKMWQIHNVQQAVADWTKLTESNGVQFIMANAKSFEPHHWRALCQGQPFQYEGKHFTTEESKELFKSAKSLLNFFDSTTSLQRYGYYNSPLFEQNFSDCRGRCESHMLAFHNTFVGIWGGHGWNHLFPGGIHHQGHLQVNQFDQVLLAQQK